MTYIVIPWIKPPHPSPPPRRASIGTNNFQPLSISGYHLSYDTRLLSKHGNWCWRRLHVGISTILAENWSCSAWHI